MGGAGGVSNNPMGPQSIAPNFTTSQTVSNRINPTVTAGGFNAGSYYAQPTGANSLALPLALGALVVALVLGAWYSFRKKKD
jgi:LPXTG-motif cell wall-anchored protein